MSFVRRLCLFAGFALVLLFTKCIFIWPPFGFFPISIFDNHSGLTFLKILGTHNKNPIIKTRKIGIGDVVKLEFRSNRKSLGGKYALEDIVFKPQNASLSSWRGKDTPCDWPSIMTDHTKYFDIEVELPIPENLNLEGNTISGMLEMKLIYPTKVQPKKFLKTGKFGSTSKKISTPLSIHVFTTEEKNLIITSWERMSFFRFWLMGVFFPAAIFLLLAGFGPKLSESTQMFFGFVLSIYFTIMACKFLYRLIGSLPFPESILLQILAILGYAIIVLILLALMFSAYFFIIHKILKIEEIKKDKSAIKG